MELGVPFDTITSAALARIISGKKEERLKAMELYKTDSTLETDKANLNSEELFTAYKSASIINHAIGFQLLSEASEVYQWDLNLSEIARIWTNGCIIRSAFMEELVVIFKETPSQNLLLHPKMINYISTGKQYLTKVTGKALIAGCPMPVLFAASNYLLSYTSGQTSANMIQAQRDFFGAHTYERTDKPKGEFFHTKWKPEI